MKSSNYIKLFFLYLLCLLLPYVIFSQSSIKRNINAEGSWDVVGDVSPSQAEEKALFEAKKNALRKAGIPTDVHSIAFSALAQGGETYSEEDFSQLNLVYIGGLVTLKEEPTIKHTFYQGIMTINVSIVADVIVEDKRDEGFILDIQGFKTYYRAGEELTFSVKPFRDCFLRVFWFDNTTIGKGNILYPIDDFNNDILLKAKTTYFFPLSGNIEKGKLNITYELETVLQKETNIIIVVATKQQIPFIGEVNYANFFKWYYNISSYERTPIKCFPFIITK
ncbi:MAG: hypothetical protein SO179_10180 [Bacteroidales bacterium]|nr:hypothetical protein [Bacteroidales bacterium]